MERRWGLSLAEVLVALAIVAAFALGLVAAAINGSRLTERDREVTRATFLAQTLMEKRVHPTREDFDGMVSHPAGVYEFADNLRDMVYRQDVGELPEPSLKRVAVEVRAAQENAATATPQPGRSPLVTLVTVVARP
ncbi:MAG: hypothetical protein AB1758_34890 [Candidatus Eremiobacterota bacterium]